MSNNRNYSRLSILITVLALSYSWFCIAQESNNSTTDGPGAPYFPGVGTWYGDPTGPGSGNAPAFIKRAFDQNILTYALLKKQIIAKEANICINVYM